MRLHNNWSTMWQLCIKYLRFQRRQENEKFACDAIVRLGELSLGFNDLPNQPVVKVFITGQDMFVSLPTSSMGSLCDIHMAIHTLRHPAKCRWKAKYYIVVSPLIALMSLKPFKVGTYVHTLLSGYIMWTNVRSHKQVTEGTCTRGYWVQKHYSLIGIERRCYRAKPLKAAFVIDEAHCIRKWW